MCYIIQHVFPKTSGGEPILECFKVNDGEWLLSRHWTVQTQCTAQLEHGMRFISPELIASIWMPLMRGWNSAWLFCASDLQINRRSVWKDEICIALFARAQSRALIVGDWVLPFVKPLDFAAPVSCRCPTHGRALIMLITAAILLLPAAPRHLAHTPTDPSRQAHT